MKILNVGHNYHVAGGSDRVLIETGELLKSKGHHVIPFCAQSDKNLSTEYDVFFPKSIDFSSVKFTSLLSYFYNFSAKHNINELLAGEVPDLAHLHIYYGRLTTSILHEIKKRNIPIIQSLHEYKLVCPVYTMERNGTVCNKCTSGRNYHCVINKCKNDSYLHSSIMALESYFSRAMGDVRYVDLFLSVSEFHRNEMVRAGIPENKVKVLHNFVDTEKYSAKCGHDGYFLYFGRIEKLKGIDTLIEAFSLVDFKLLIVGDGSYKNNMLEKIESISNIEYLGFREGQELIDIVSKSLCVVVPSEWNENCPMNVLEAKSLSRPVIGSNIGGIPELINHNVDGVIFEPGNVSQLVNALFKVNDLFDTMSYSARLDAVDRFSKEAYYLKLMSFYEMILRRKKQ
ncbi:glycosyltransferase [Vibrio cholerae]|uniref:glycosyltransferase n=1 Tax=Vibrio cholerae TaxID=666 RepID=UPI003966FB6E